MVWNTSRDEAFCNWNTQNSEILKKYNRSDTRVVSLSIFIRYSIVSSTPLSLYYIRVISYYIQCLSVYNNLLVSKKYSRYYWKKNRINNDKIFKIVLTTEDCTQYVKFSHIVTTFISYKLLPWNKTETMPLAQLRLFGWNWVCTVIR